MKVCLLSKYPPIEGGMSSKTYWLAKSLGERGHEIHIVTNSLEVEKEYREELDPNDPNFMPKNVRVHYTDPSPTIEANPSHIPFSKMYCEKLASKAIEVIEEYNLELIDSRYLIPYSVAGYLAKSFAGIPQIISHAGSDLQRLYPSPYLKKLLENILKSADRVIANPETLQFFESLGIAALKISLMPQIYVEMNAFNPDVSRFDFEDYTDDQRFSPDVPVIAYLGKITNHFETKGLPALLKACSKISKKFLLLFVANGKKMEDFKALVKDESLTQKTLFLPFLPPWKIPSIMKSCTCIVALENSSSPVLSYHVPVVPAEAMATGRCVLMSKELHKRDPFVKLENGKDVLVVDCNDMQSIKVSLERIIGKPEDADVIGANARNAFIQNKGKGYVDEIVRVYQSLNDN
jgi:glycosyltransferase involved in cell wall biosynthesis